MGLFSNFKKRVQNIFSPKGKVRKAIDQAVEWVGEHPEHIKMILELAGALKKGELDRLGAKVLGTNQDRDTVKVKLEDGRIVEVPMEYVRASDEEVKV